jgi:hypothetical protein
LPAPNSQVVGAHAGSLLLLLLRSRPLLLSEPSLKLLLLLPSSSPFTRPVVDDTAVLTAPVTLVTAPSAPCRWFKRRKLVAEEQTMKCLCTS